MSKLSYSNIKSEIKKASKVFIMGHKYVDLDVIGSSLGLYCYSKNFGKEAYIVLDDTVLEDSSKKAIDAYIDKVNIIKSNMVFDYVDKKSLLIIVDVNRKKILQNDKILDLFKNIIVLDHHHLSDDSIDSDTAKLFINEASSSASEMVVNILKNDNLIIDNDIATVLLAGIVLDTNNFVIKTSSKTYYAAYYLSKWGADPKEVQYLLKQDIEKYIERQKVITDVKLINSIAISKGLQNEIYRREDLAKIADTILLFNNVEASFVIGKISKHSVGISARSMGKVNVGEIMEKFGGGGNNNEAACKIVDKSLKDVFDQVVAISKKLKK